MVIVRIDKKSKMPMFKQVIEQLREKIDSQVLEPGYQLPSTRQLASKLGVNRATIYKAYQELWALGYIESRSGSYSYVRQKRDQITQRDITKETKIDWSKKINPRVEEVYEMFGVLNYPFSQISEEFDGIDLGRLHPDTRIFPIDEYRKSLNKVMQQRGDRILDYGTSRGDVSLREYIAHRLRLHGVTTNKEEILITNGAQNAIDLLMKLFTKPGDRVFVESPTYGMVIPTLKFYGCEIVSIPMKKDGVDLSTIEKEFAKGLPVFFYTMPNFHNPTGITTDQTHREKLIALFEKFKVPIIEDAYEEEMKYFGKVPLPIKSMDINQIVIYIGSFSKILFPGIRLGWISANDEIITRLAMLKRFGDISSTLPAQAALADFCQKGHYEIHIKRIHKVYRRRMLLAMQQLDKHIKNKNISWIEPNGGYTIWFTFKNTKKSYYEIDRIFHKNKVRLALGKDFYPDNEPDQHFRIAIASLNDDEIVEGIKRLSGAINEIYNI